MADTADHCPELPPETMAALDAAIRRGISDADAERVHRAEQVFAELRAKYLTVAEAKGRLSSRSSAE
jgi:hypothetical protein